MSYIIKNDQLIAKTERTLKSGEQVQFSAQTCRETIDANRDRNLVNAQTGVISNAEKWEKVYLASPIFTAVEINPGEFAL